MPSTKLSVKDIEFLQLQYNKIRDEAIKYNQKDLETKKEYILRLKEKAIELFRAEDRDMQELASYIRNDLIENQFSIAQSYYFELFTENEKRNYSDKFGSEHLHEFVNGKCPCGIIQIEGINYEPVMEEKVTDAAKILKKDLEKEDPYTNTVTEYYQRIADNCNFLASIASDLVSKYYGSEEIAKVMEEESTLDGLKAQKDLEAHLLSIAKFTDMRQKIGKFEKLKALLLERCEFNIAKVAKELDITAKHMSANIMGKERDTLISKLKWFRSIETSCKSCGKHNETDIAHWFNHQYERQELDLPLQKGIFN